MRELTILIKSSNLIIKTFHFYVAHSLNPIYSIFEQQTTIHRKITIV